MLSDLAFPLVAGGAAIAILIHRAIRITRASRALQASGRPRPRSVVVVWISIAVALAGYAVVVAAGLPGLR